MRGRLLVAVLSVVSLTLPATACAAPAVAPPAEDRAAAFDRTFARLTGPASLDATTDAYEADLARLRDLLPPGDRRRDASFRSLDCGSLRWKDAGAGLTYSDGALQLARAVGDLPAQVRAQLCRANYLMLDLGSQHGLEDVDKAIALLQGGEHQQLLGEALEMRGDTLSLLGEQAKAMLDFQRARAAYRAAGIEHEVEALMFSIAVAYRRIGDWPQAQRYFDSAVARMRAGKDWEGVATNLIQLGFLFEESGEPEKSAAAFREAEKVAAQNADAYSLNAARLGLAGTQIALGDPATALETLARARAGFEADNDHSSDDMLLLMAGQALARQGQHSAAMERYGLALPLIERNGNQRYLAMLYQARAASLEALGATAAALADYKRYNELLLALQRKMRIEQSRLLDYEFQIRHREYENRMLRAEAGDQQAQVRALERVRRWQAVALLLGALLLALLSSIALRQWRKSRRLRQLTLLDPLTGTASRLGIEQAAERARAQSRLDGRPLSLLMLDLDHFKDVNDRHGHAVGDRVLRAAAEAWQAQLRGRDPIGRVGGEEFVVVCEDTTLEQALAVADRLREATAGLRFDDIDPALRVTLSMGAAQYRGGEETGEELLARADAALYRAKQRGRDRIET